MTQTVAQLSSPVLLEGDYESTGDVLYLSTRDDNKGGACVLSEEGHGVRMTADGRVTHVTLISAKWFLERDGELVVTLPDGRVLRLDPADYGELLPS